MKEKSRIESLKKTALFSSLSSDDLHQVEGKIHIRNFKKDDIILREENTNEFMYIIIEGEAKVIQTTEQGKEILVTMHQAGDFFGELSLIDGKTAPAAVCATADCVTAIISKAEFYSLLLTQHKILENLLHILCSRLRESMKKIQMMNFSSASQRVKMLLLMISENYGEKTEKGTILNIRLIHQDIADMTGLTRETVTRVLDKLRKNNEIKVLKNRRILLLPEFESIPF